MISTLLWRCPNCKTQDALTHEKRRIRHDLVTCNACQTQWKLIRVFGGPDYKMQVISGEHIGLEQPVAKWYDQMMAELILEPIHHPGWPIEGISEPGEDLYLFSPVINAFSLPDDPIFQDEKFTPVDGGALPIGLEPIGPGQLAFTPDRLVYVLKSGATISLPWVDLRAADTMIDMAFTIRSRERLLFFVLGGGQSVLKWLAHVYLIVDRLQLIKDQKIHLGSI